MESQEKRTHFIRDIIEKDRETGTYEGRVHTRFPPEPNGYLHIGHAKSICLNFGIANEYDGLCNLRFDDTNPETEDTDYVNSIIEDVKWLGCDWGDRLYYASDYFDTLYDCACRLIKKDKAYVCDLSVDEVRRLRGTITEPGKESPFRARPAEENLDLFARMKEGEFPDGSKTLRAKIDMSSPHLIMRDPPLYRIRHAHHHRTKDAWCIYPMYDFTHCISDSIEKITHSLCTLEFENNRRLYDWILEALDLYHPQQIEFARLNLSFTIMSKRKLRALVEKKAVNGWDDPRMPTISGLRRRGYTASSIRAFTERIGVSRYNSTIDITVLENCIREELNLSAPRAMAVLDPVKVVITNYPEGQEEELEAINNPEDSAAGTRRVPFSRELFIEREDFMEDPPKKFYRLAPGREVRLRYAYFITCTGIRKDPSTNALTEIHCTYDPATRGGDAPDGRRVKATLHWVSAGHAVSAEVRLYERLFTAQNPEGIEGKDYMDTLNRDSLKKITHCRLEPSLAGARPGVRYQFERKGYFWLDSDSREGHLIFNRIVTLRDSWAKIAKKSK